MNLPNVVAVGLVAFAAGFFLFGLLMATSSIFVDVDQVLDEAAKIGSPPVPEGQRKLLTAMPWMTSLFMFFFMAIPAALLGFAGFAVWRFLGRPRIAAVESAASEQSDKERLLQEVFDEAVRQSLAPTRNSEERLALQLQRTVLSLNPSRQERLLMFVDDLALTAVPEVVRPEAATKLPRPSMHRVLIGRLAGLCFLLVAALFLLWPITMMLILPAFAELSRVTLGSELTPELMLIGFGGVVPLLAIPTVLGLGLIGLGRLEKQLVVHWDQQVVEAEAVLLEFLERHLRHFRTAGLLKNTDPPGNLALQALINADTLGLSGSGRREVLETLRRFGLESLAPAGCF